MPINPPTSTLQTIQTKVRRLTRSLSTAQLTDDDLNQYINTFVVYDIPEHLRLFNLRTQFTFYTNPFQDVYPTDTLSFLGVTTNPLYDFQNRYISVHPPVYIAGYESFYSQSREQFYAIYPLTNNIASIGVTGDGVNTQFSGVVVIQQGAILNPTQVQQVALLQNNVLFSSVDVDFNGLAMIDVPVMNTTTGNPTIIGNLVQPTSMPSAPPITVDPTNFINYVTGEFVVTFPTAPLSGATINSQTIPQVATLPQALLFYDDQFIVRPIPDQPYRVNFEAYIKPTALLDTTQNPDLNEWWQYIAYGAAKKVFEDRMDMESVQLILPEFNKQERLVLRRTIVQYTNERTATIYTEQTSFGSGWGGWGQGGGPF
jgi:hypothetical protein